MEWIILSTITTLYGLKFLYFLQEFSKSAEPPISHNHVLRSNLGDGFEDRMIASFRRKLRYNDKVNWKEEGF